MLALVPATYVGAADPAGGVALPEAPVRLWIPDASAFDQALGGGFRRALTGTLDESDGVANAWRQTQVGSKVTAQWERLSADLPWTWDQIRRLQPRALGLALLEVGHLEAVLVIETGLAALPNPLPAGRARTHKGVAYHLVEPGAGDGSSDSERRMGLAYAHGNGRLLLATSERALQRTVEAEQAGQRFAPSLTGLVALDLDLDVLRKDRYFRREFPWSPGPEQGHVQAALRLENGRLVEWREGQGETRPAAPRFELPRVALVGWEPDGAALWPALRAGLLEPWPRALLRAEPLPALRTLPAAVAAQQEDRYLVSLERPAARGDATPFEEGELTAWRALWQSQAPAGFGFAVDGDGTRRLVFAWPEARQAELETLCVRTLERLAGRVTVVATADARELQIGPGLAALALKRTGAYVWLASSARALAGVPTPQDTTDIVRWARLDLDVARQQGERWARVEGPASPEQVRPLADRVLGLLGWMPETHSLSVERQRTPRGWSERVVFGAP
jgi:hypothetical protein